MVTAMVLALSLPLPMPMEFLSTNMMGHSVEMVNDRRKRTTAWHAQASAIDS